MYRQNGRTDIRTERIKMESMYPSKYFVRSGKKILRYLRCQSVNYQFCKTQQNHFSWVFKTSYLHSRLLPDTSLCKIWIRKGIPCVSKNTKIHFPSWFLDLILIPALACPRDIDIHAGENPLTFSRIIEDYYVTLLYVCM